MTYYQVLQNACCSALLSISFRPIGASTVLLPVTRTYVQLALIAMRSNPHQQVRPLSNAPMSMYWKFIGSDSKFTSQRGRNHTTHHPLSQGRRAADKLKVDVSAHFDGWRQAVFSPAAHALPHCMHHLHNHMPVLLLNRHPRGRLATAPCFLCLVLARAAHRPVSSVKSSQYFGGQTCGLSRLVRGSTRNISAICFLPLDIDKRPRSTCQTYTQTVDEQTYIRHVRLTIGARRLGFFSILKRYSSDIRPLFSDSRETKRHTSKRGRPRHKKVYYLDLRIRERELDIVVAKS